MARKITVEILGDSRSLENSFKRSSKSASNFQREMSRLGRGGLATSGVFNKLGRAVSFASPQFLTGAGLAAAFKTSIQAASDLNEQLGKTQVVFGNSAAAVDDWSKTTTQAFGLSQRQALETASSFGALFQPLGILGRQAAQQSEKLTQLGADLASFYNTDVQSALDAIQSGLVGESEPLRRYGVLLSETRVQQEALTETGKRHASQLTDQEKVLARINIIMRDSKQAQGDFQRSSGRLAGQTKTLTANANDLAAGLGQQLVPVATNATLALNKTAQAAQESGKHQGVLAGVIHGATRELKQQIPAVSVLGPLWKLAGHNFGEAATNADALTAALQKMRGAVHAVGTLTQGIKPGAFSDLPGVTPFKGPAPITAEQRQQFRDRRLSQMLDVVQDIPTLKGQIARLRQIAGLVKQWRDAATDVTRQQTLQSQLLQIQREILGDQAQIADKAKQAALDAAQKRKEALAAMREKRAAREFGVLGFGPGGEDPVPGIRNLRKQFQQLSAHIQGTAFDTKSNRSILGRIRKALDFKTLEPEVRQKIRDLLAGIRDEFQKGATEVTKFRGVNTNQFLASLGLDLTPAQRRRLQAGIAGFSVSHGRLAVAAGHTGAFALAGGMVINGGVHLHGVQDVKGMEGELSRRAKARSHQRRGAR